MKPLNEYIEHTNLKPEATLADIQTLCNEAMENNFYGVCVNSCNVSMAKALLQGSDVKIVSVVGFPLGAACAEAKAFEADWACSVGANEIDMVMNIGFFKDKKYEYVIDDIVTVVSVAKEYDAIVKVIIETCLLTDEEIVTACKLAVEAGAEFVKTSTGFNSGGATAHHIKLMKKTLGDSAKIKASGGIRDYKTAMVMINAGADRIGASASVSIINKKK